MKGPRPPLPDFALFPQRDLQNRPGQCAPAGLRRYRAEARHPSPERQRHRRLGRYRWRWQTGPHRFRQRRLHPRLPQRGRQIHRRDRRGRARQSALGLLAQPDRLRQRRLARPLHFAEWLERPDAAICSSTTSTANSPMCRRRAAPMIPVRASSPLWGDLDNDGWLDLVIANGVLQEGSVTADLSQ